MPVLLLKTEKETQHLAIKLAKCCAKNKRFIIFLSGELGAGKTFFVRSFIKSLGYQGAVKSPTYTLVECYEISTYPIYHLDLHRLQDPIDILDMGLYDEFDLPAIWLIEWPERAMSFLPPPDIVLNFNLVGTTRQVQFDAKTGLGKQTLSLLQKTSS
jgi:tRNA threonylcarbamoyladenosine biosynthesis protein TsaE